MLYFSYGGHPDWFSYIPIRDQHGFWEKEGIVQELIPLHFIRVSTDVILHWGAVLNIPTL